MPKKGEYLNFKNYEKETKSLLIIYADFEIILVPGARSRSKNPEETYTNKHQKHTACSYGHTLVCVDNNYGEFFKIY